MPDPGESLITLRPATAGDCLRVWEWRNESETRASSFETGVIPYQGHMGWFSSKLGDPHIRIFILEDMDRRQVGYVRFDIDGDQAEISVSVDRDHRDKGYGSMAIMMGSDGLLVDGLAKSIVAWVKRDNPASIAAFRRAGFRMAGHTNIGGTVAHRMVYGAAIQASLHIKPEESVNPVTAKTENKWAEPGSGTEAT